jgi:hypothetical protein
LQTFSIVNYVYIFELPHQVREKKGLGHLGGSVVVHLSSQ